MSERRLKIASTHQEISEINQKLNTLQDQIKEIAVHQEELKSRKKQLTQELKHLEDDEFNQLIKIQWDADTFSWSENVLSTLKEKFHIQQFRPLQKETINATLSNLDCILIMPTGGGKSLSFQLTAVVSEGFTLVVSPLISLMEDQIIGLKRINIEATALSSSVPPKEITAIQNQLINESCPYKLVYVTPERVAKSKRFMAKLEKAYTMGNISRIVIDEVHCASHWGHDFRPDYKILGILKRQFPKLPILGLTATASKKVLDDVKDMLNLQRSCLVFRASFNRPNLMYEVHHTCLDSKELTKLIGETIKSRFYTMSGIVYCFSRKDCEDVARGLCTQGIKASSYHSDMNPDFKSKTHLLWSTGELQVVVATIAFGMGIDKSNVRFVIHYSMSKSIENYYQESGRAGRDDETAWCILYYRFQDVFRQSSMVFTEKTGLQNLYKMLEYCIDSMTCRREQIGKHFAESWNSTKCKQMCDNCLSPSNKNELQLNKDAIELVSILQKATDAGERLTPLKLVELWKGKGKVSLRVSQTTKHSRELCEVIVTKLVIEQVLTEDYHFTPYNTITYIVAGPKFRLLKSGEITVDFQVCDKLKDMETSEGVIQTNAKKRQLVDIEQDNSDCNQPEEQLERSSSKRKKKTPDKSVIISIDSD